MKKLHWFDKVLFFLNSLFAAALLFSYLLPFIPPKSFALLSVLSLAVPMLIIINAVFLIYWLIKLKRQLMLSLVVLLLGFNHITSIYGFSSESNEKATQKDLSILSYNVRQFNQYGWTGQEDIPQKISNFIEEQNPDILSMQEYFKGEHTISESYTYKFINLKDPRAEFGLAIFSKFPVINSGSLDFPTGSNNNAIYADVIIEKDTLRIINLHLQSFSVKPDMKKMEQEHSKKVFKGMGQTFVLQQNQLKMVLDLIENTPYKTIITGDFNNTAYSYIYRKLLSKGFLDAHKEEGIGFGRTFDFNFFPLRIDFILPERSFEVLSFKTIEVPFSDHFPIKAKLKLKQESTYSRPNF